MALQGWLAATSAGVSFPDGESWPGSGGSPGGWVFDAAPLSWLGEISAEQRLSWDQSPDPEPWPVLERVLTDDAECFYTGRVYPAGTVVVAPLRPIAYDRADAPRVPCCHDNASLRATNMALYYATSVLSSFRHAATAGFCPLTLGDGRVAEEHHPEHPNHANAAYLATRALEFATSREPERFRATMHAWHSRFVWYSLVQDFLGPIFVHEDGTHRHLVFRALPDVRRMRTMLWDAARRAPRTAAAALPQLARADAEGIDDAILPRGAPQCVIADGVVVQSDAAWAIRADPRVRAAMYAARGSDNPFGVVPIDLPVIAFTHTSLSRRFSADTREWMWLLDAPAGGGDAITTTGAVCLGPGVLPLWTPVNPATVATILRTAGERREAPARRVLSTLPASIHIQRITEATSRAVIGQSVTIVPDARWSVFCAQLQAVNMTDALVTLTWRGGAAMVLRYAQIDPGRMYARSTRVPVIDLPPLTTRANSAGLTLGVMLGEAPPTHPMAVAMRDRVERGVCADRDLYGMPTGARTDTDPAETQRLHALIPRTVAPYASEAVSAGERDNRVQNLLYARPYREAFIYTSLI